MLSRRQIAGLLPAAFLRAQEKPGSIFGDAEAYDRFMGRWSRLVAPPLIDFAGIPDNGRVLDVGSGTGALALAIADRKPQSRVVGIDPSKEYVAYASSRASAAGRVTFETGDAQQLRFADASFDNSLSLLVFNFIPDHTKALREVVRVTKPGGRIAAAVWDYGGGMRMLRLFWDGAVSLDPAAAPLDEKRMPLCRQGELTAVWRAGRLKDVEERPLDINMRFQSFADYWEPFLLGQGPAGAYVKRLNAPRVAALRDEVKRRLKLSAEAAPFELTARVWAVRGTRS